MTLPCHSRCFTLSICFEALVQKWPVRDDGQVSRFVPVENGELLLFNDGI